MFGLNTHSLPSASDYASALRVWEHAYCWRTTRDDDLAPRGLKNTSKSTHLTVRKDRDRNIYFKYHNTEVVIWHPDNSVTLTPYNSRNTNQFGNCFTPCGVTCFFDFSYGYSTETAVAIGKDLYNLGSLTKARLIRMSTQLPSGSHVYIFDPETEKRLGMWEDRRADKKLTTQIRKEYNINKFSKWYQAMEKTNPDPNGLRDPLGRTKTYDTVPPLEVFKMIKAEAYDQVVDATRAHHNPLNYIHKLYEHLGAIKSEYHRSITFSEARALSARMRKY